MGIYTCGYPFTIAKSSLLFCSCFHDHVVKGGLRMTITDYSARKKRMAAILGSEEAAGADEAMPSRRVCTTEHANTSTDAISPPPHATAAHMQGSHSADVRLDEIEIDLHQPRRFLPDDLRQAFASHQTNHQDILTQLTTGTADGDVEAASYLSDMRSLANDIQMHGKLYPALVYTHRDRDGSTCYRLIDGERRFWAHVYLGAQPDSQVTTLRAELRDQFEHANGEDIERMQRSVNMQRESVCTIDIGEFIQTKRNAAVRAIHSDAQLLTRWSDDGKPLGLRDAVQRIVCDELTHTFGKPLKRRA
jgi:hypothetical protein